VTAPANLRGAAFGLFNLVTGVIVLVASVVAGLLWNRLGPSATFLAGAAFTAIALVGLTLVDPAHRPAAAGDTPARRRETEEAHRPDGDR
jgi:hypothetical protein